MEALIKQEREFVSLKGSKALLCPFTVVQTSAWFRNKYSCWDNCTHRNQVHFEDASEMPFQLSSSLGFNILTSLSPFFSPKWNQPVQNSLLFYSMTFKLPHYVQSITVFIKMFPSIGLQLPCLSRFLLM